MLSSKGCGLGFTQSGKPNFVLPYLTCKFKYHANREEVKAQVHRVSGNSQEGFNSLREAQQAYAFAYAIGAVRVLSPHGAGPASAPAAPIPAPIMQAFEECDSNFLGADWHVVFKGLTPGIYPTW